MKRKYKLPYISPQANTEEKEFLWNEEEQENYERVVRIVRRMSLSGIENHLVEFIWFQLTGRIEVVDSKEE